MTDIENLSKKLFCLIDNNYIEHRCLDKKISELKNKIDKINKTNIVYVENNELNHNIEEYIDTKTNDNYEILENKSFEYIVSLFEKYKNEKINNTDNTEKSSPELFTNLHVKIDEKNNILKADIQSKMLLIQNIANKSIKKTHDDLHLKIESESSTTKKELIQKILNIETFFETVKKDIENKINTIKKNEEILRNFLCTRLDNIENYIEKNNCSSLTNDNKSIGDSVMIDIDTEISSCNINIKQKLKDELKAEIKAELKNELLAELKTELVAGFEDKPVKDDGIVVHYSEDARFSAVLKDNKQSIIKEIFDNLEIILKNNKKIIIKEVFDSFEIVLSSKFLESNKNILEFVKKNGFDLIFSNKETAYKIETWIQKQIDESIKSI